jgi:molybdopterin converting factor small subunit
VNLIFINGRNADFNTPLSEGDTVSFFPPVGGG